MSQLFNLEHQMPFYGAYHSNPTNILIHKIFVPAILFSAFVWLSNTGALVSGSLWPSFLPESNAATLLACAVIPGYVKMHTRAGLMLAPILLGMTAGARYLTLHVDRANTYASVIQYAPPSLSVLPLLAPSSVY